MRYMQMFDWAFFITVLTEGILVPLSLVLKYKLIVSSLLATTEFPILAQKPHLQDFKHFFQYLISSWYLLLYAFTYFQCISRHFSCFMHCRIFLLDSSLTMTQISVHSSLSNPLHLFFSAHHLITRNIADLYLVGLTILFIFFSLICHRCKKTFCVVSTRSCSCWENRTLTSLLAGYIVKLLSETKEKLKWNSKASWEWDKSIEAYFCDCRIVTFRKLRYST